MTTSVCGQTQRQRVLVLGGTGSIGAAVARSLSNRGHQVTCLARSHGAEDQLRKSNFNILRGDIRSPEQWVEKVAGFDAIIQTAITWSEDMSEVDDHLVSVLLDGLSAKASGKTLIYTGGCWLYGQTHDRVATEDSPYSSIADFAWCIDTGAKVLSHPGVRGMVIHPAMVYERDGGVLEPMINDIQQLGKLRVIGNKDICWTMVHRNDLGELYSLALEKGKGGENYNGSSIQGIKVGLLAKTLAHRFNLSTELEVLPVDAAVSKLGHWASGYALNQQMSSEKAMTELGWNPKYTDILSDIG